MKKTNVTVYNPNKLRNELMAPVSSWFDQIFSDLLNESPFDFNCAKTRAYPKADIRKEGKDIVVEAAVPFLNKENLKVELDEAILTISGDIKKEEIKEGDYYYKKELVRSSFSRSWPIDKDIYDKWLNTQEGGASKVDAILKDGVLTVRLKDILENGHVNEKKPTLIEIKELE